MPYFIKRKNRDNYQLHLAKYIYKIKENKMLQLYLYKQKK